jgi:hypothetical protein
MWPGKRTRSGAAGGGHLGLAGGDFLRAAADDGDAEVGGLGERGGQGAEEEVDALVDGEGADVEGEDVAGGDAEAFAGLPGQGGIGFDERGGDVEDVVDGFAGGDPAGLLDEGGAGANDGVGAEDRKAFDAPVGGHDEIAEESFFIGGGIGVFFEDHFRAVAAGEDGGDGAGILDAVEDVVAVFPGEGGGLEEQGDVEDGLGGGGADGKGFDAEDVGGAVEGDAGDGEVVADGHGEQVDGVAEFGEGLGVEADAQGGAAPLEEGLGGDEQDAALRRAHGIGGFCAACFSCALRRRRRSTDSGEPRRPPKAMSRWPAASAALRGATRRAGSSGAGMEKAQW